MSLSALSVTKLLSYGNRLVEDAVSVFVQDWTIEGEVVEAGVTREANVATPFSRLTAFVPMLQIPPSEWDGSNTTKKPTLLVTTASQSESDWDSRTDLHYMLMLTGLPEEWQRNPDSEINLLTASSDPPKFVNAWYGLTMAEEKVPIALLTAVAERVNQQLLIVEEKHEVVATIRITRDKHIAGLSMLAVDMRHREQGLGTSVVKDAIKLARSQGARQFHLQVDGTNESALSLYHRLGAIVVARYRYS
jgi:ribosomal protein S18 acetylase RimI-like enzyme